jgi:CheY-like chemotaxis protein
MSRSLTIILIEDDEGHARLIEKNIRRAGVRNLIRTFNDGTAAMAHLFGPGPGGTRIPDPAILVLLDLNLPDMNGTDILRAIKENQILHRTPVIVLTTTDDRAEIQKCYDLGCNVYITKPVDYDAFATAIRQLGLFLEVIQVPENE